MISSKSDSTLSFVAMMAICVSMYLYPPVVSACAPQCQNVSKCIDIKRIWEHTSILCLHIKSTNSQPPSFPHQLSIEAVMPCWGEAGAPKHLGLDAIS